LAVAFHCYEMPNMQFSFKYCRGVSELLHTYNNSLSKLRLALRAL